MSLTVQTSVSSLISLGLSIGDVATLWSYGKTVGNFLTTVQADNDLLAVLDTDDTAILQRKGLFDPLRWNKKWTSELNIMVNGKPETIKDKRARAVYEAEPTRFTQIMISLTAVLRPFATSTALARIIARFLKRLLEPTEDQEAFLDSRRQTLLRAWDSSGVARGLVGHCKDHHTRLVKDGIVLDGLIPEGECDEVVDFL
jgi:hypothetical protein